MKEENLILGSLFTFCLVAAYRRNKTKPSIGRCGKINDYENQKFITSIPDVIDVFKNGYLGTINNGEINFVGDGEVILSDDIQHKVGLPRVINTVSQLRKAVSYLKNTERGLLFRFASEEDEYNYKILSKKNILKNAVEKLNITDDVSNVEQAYYRTLYAIATGTKFKWKSTKTNKGVKDELFATRTNAQAERNARKSYLSDKKGISPEVFAEQITKYGEDDYYVKTGVLDAIRSVNNPSEAVSILDRIITSKELPFEPTSDNMPF